MAAVNKESGGNYTLILNQRFEYIDYTNFGQNFLVMINEDAARSLYKELGDLFAENTNEG